MSKPYGEYDYLKVGSRNTQGFVVDISYYSTQLSRKEQLRYNYYKRRNSKKAIQHYVPSEKKIRIDIELTTVQIHTIQSKRWGLYD